MKWCWICENKNSKFRIIQKTLTSSLFLSFTWQTNRSQTHGAFKHTKINENRPMRTNILQILMGKWTISLFNTSNSVDFLHKKRQFLWDILDCFVSSSTVSWVFGLEFLERSNLFMLSTNDLKHELYTFLSYPISYTIYTIDWNEIVFKASERWIDKMYHLKISKDLSNVDLKCRKCWMPIWKLWKSMLRDSRTRNYKKLIWCALHIQTNMTKHIPIPNQRQRNAFHTIFGHNQTKNQQKYHQYPDTSMQRCAFHIKHQLCDQCI